MGLIAESGSVVGGDILYEGKSLFRNERERKLRSFEE